jgi:sugar/nucleoside kinase (ribokinase family)
MSLNVLFLDFSRYDSHEIWGGIPELCPLMDIVFVNEDEAVSCYKPDEHSLPACPPAASSRKLTQAHVISRNLTQSHALIVGHLWGRDAVTT